MIDAVIEKLSDTNSSASLEESKSVAMQLLFQTADAAKKFYNYRRDVRTKEALNQIDEVLALQGRLLCQNLKIYKMSGATVKELVSILNADWGMIHQIKNNGDQDRPFDELVIKYKLADDTYPALAEAIKIYKEGEIK